MVNLCLLALCFLATCVFNVFAQHYSCADIMGDGSIPDPKSDGEYTIDIDGGSTQTVYCSFDYVNNFAWTLIESAQYIYHFHGSVDYPWKDDLPQNEASPDANRNDVYRMSLGSMDSIRSRSTHLYSTCNFDLSMTVDYWLLSLSGQPLDPWVDTWGGECFETEKINIRGFDCVNGGVPVWNVAGEHIHVSAVHSFCSCGAFASSGAVGSEDAFGWYGGRNTVHSCVATDSSTTQYWLGSEPVYTNTAEDCLETPACSAWATSWPDGVTCVDDISDPNYNCANCASWSTTICQTCPPDMFKYQYGDPCNDISVIPGCLSVQNTNGCQECDTANGWELRWENGCAMNDGSTQNVAWCYKECASEPEPEPEPECFTDVLITLMQSGTKTTSYWLKDSNDVELASGGFGSEGLVLIQSVACDSCYVFTIDSEGRPHSLTVDVDGVSVVNKVLPTDPTEWDNNYDERFNQIFCTGISTLAPLSSGGCPSGTTEVHVEVSDSNYISDLFYWIFNEHDGNVVAFDSEFSDLTFPVSQTICLEPDCYEFDLYDRLRDGLAADPNNYYRITVNGQTKVEYLSTGEHFSVKSEEFCVGYICPEECSTDPCSEAEAGNCGFYEEGEGCKQCSSGSFKKDWEYPCVDCQDTFGSKCIHCQDLNGCAQCATEYDRVYSESCGLYFCEPNACYFDTNHCSVCNNGVCSQCDNTYFKYNEDDTKCFQCQAIFGDECMHCTDYLGCQQCINGYDRTYNEAAGVYECIDPLAPPPGRVPAPTVTRPPTPKPTVSPTTSPTRSPTKSPTKSPTENPTAAPVCNLVTKREVAFILDDSGSVGPSNFESVKDFVIDVIDNDLDPESLISVISFDRNAANGISVDYRFSDNQDRTTVKNAISSLSFSGGVTPTGPAVDAAISEFEAVGSDAIENLLIIITDGVPCCNPDNTVCEAGDDDKARLDAAGVPVFIVGVGSFNINTITCLVDDPDTHIVQIGTFDELPGVLNRICG